MNKNECANKWKHGCSEKWKNGCGDKWKTDVPRNETLDVLRNGKNGCVKKSSYFFVHIYLLLSSTCFCFVMLFLCKD